MKNTIFFLFLALSISANATKWRVNSNTAVGAHFHTLKEAIAGAAADDTLYMEASGAVYGTADTINKKLIIIGTGYFKGENYPTNTFNVHASQLNKVVFEPGSEGTILMSMQLYSAVINADNITITKCYFYDNTDDDLTMLIVNGNNAIITKNYLEMVNQYDTYGYDFNIVMSVISIYKSNAIISNNYLYKNGYADYTWNLLYTDLSSSSTVTNNVFYGVNGYYDGRGSMLKLNNCYFANNITFGTIYFRTINNSTFINNLSSNAIGTANGNIQNATISSVFVSSGTSDSKYKLADASPAKGTGVNGIDMGIFGGIDPYVLSGMPTLPTVYHFEAPGQVSNQTGLKLTIKAKTSN